MKKYVAFILTVIMTISLVGCGKAKTDIDESTLGGKLASKFMSSIEKSTDIEAIANDIANESGYDCIVVPMEEGYLSGFSEEITGFNKAVAFAPMIGSIPFVGYIFETDDADALKNKLLAVADPRWNICTEAAETVCETYGNYVFFTMCPGEDQ